MNDPALASVGSNKQITYFQVFVHLTDFYRHPTNTSFIINVKIQEKELFVKNAD